MVVMRKASMPAAAWCLVSFFIWDLVAASLVAYYIICPSCWPFHVYREHISTTEISEDLCQAPPCVRKCCPEGEELLHDHIKAECNSTYSSNFTLSIVPLWENNSYVNDTDHSTDEYYDRYSIISTGLCPEGMFELDPTIEDDQYALLADGNLFLIKAREVVDRDNYCIDIFRGDESTKVFRCFPQASIAELSEIEQRTYPWTMTVSLLFLTITTLVYILLPELQNLHGKCLLSHVSCLTIAFFFLILVQINAFDLNFNNPRMCIVSAFVIQFSFLATFFWLNVMCFDIWWVFSGLRPLRGSVKEREHKKFILYSLYAWGGPLLIFTISLIMEIVPSIPDTFIKPRFGVDKCWFKDSDALVLYFYLPIGVLVLLNIVMFITTAFRLRAHTNETKVLQSSESRRNDEAERQRFNLYLKLFIVMGITWVMELVSFVIGGPKSIWFVTDIGNTLQGLLIFLIFVWKRRILRLLNQKLCPQWELVSAASTSTRSKTEKQEPAKTNIK